MARSAAFTLIELSIVLVIIGLLVGGVLVGRDLIAAASVRAQISQIEKFNTAARTFRTKYGYLPGDIPDPTASQFWLSARSPTLDPGKGDGNGIIRGLYNGWAQDGGETLMFWVDLSYANGLNLNLIEGKFSLASAVTSFDNLPPYFSTMSTTVNVGFPSMNDFLPKAKLNATDYVYAWSGGVSNGDGNNYFTLSGVTRITDAPEIDATPGVTPNQAYAIDKKIDDGLPQTGNVTAIWNDSNTCGGPCYVAGMSGNPGLTSASTGGAVTAIGDALGETNTTNTCYDYPDPTHPTLPLSYSTTTNGTLNNCSLTFKMQ